MERRVVTFDNADAVAAEGANEFEVRAHAALENHERFCVALSGGATPVSMLKLLASPDYAEDIDWSRIHFFWSDERCVPPEDKNSNFREAYHTLLAPLQIADENIHRMPGELDPEAGAQSYNSELARFFGPNIVFDLIYLGLGADGHTASLFPHNSVLEVANVPCTAVHVPNNQAATWRLTLTYPVLNASRAVIFLVAGGEKVKTVARVLEGPFDPDMLPAQGVAPELGSLIWLIDRAAAAQLKTRA